MNSSICSHRKREKVDPLRQLVTLGNIHRSQYKAIELNMKKAIAFVLKSNVKKIIKN